MTKQMRQYEQLFGTYEIKDMTSFPGDEKYRRVRVVWGSKTERFRSAASPHIERYGVLFGVDKFVYLVDEHFEQRELLQDICKTRERYFTINPLLQRLDFCGLYGVLAGLPVTIEEIGGVKMVLVGIGYKNQD